MANREPCQCWHLDLQGEPLALGDLVSQPLYPKGTMRGTVALSERAFCVACNGSAWVVLSNEDQRSYSLSGKVRRLKKQSSTKDPLSEIDGRWYICVYEHAWGRGKSATLARKEAKKAGGRGSHWVTYRLPEDAGEPRVDPFGYSRWSWPDGWTEEQYEEANQRKNEVVAKGRGLKEEKK